MPLRRGFGGLSSGAGGNLFDRPGFFNQAEIDNLTLNADLLLKRTTETYGIYLSHGDTSGATANYTATIPALSANGEMVITTAGQNLTVGNLTSTAAIDWDLIDDNASALSFDATGKAGILEIDTRDGEERVYMSGDLTVAGDLTVSGTQTIINSATLQIDDKNIDLAHSPSGSEGDDADVDGGGITLKSSDSDKTFQWADAGDNWTSSENLSLATGKVFKINNVSMLSNTTLGTSVINSSLTSTAALTGGSIASGFGTISTGNAITTTNTVTGETLAAGNIEITGNTISSTSGNLILDANTDLNFSDDTVLNVGTIKVDKIRADNVDVNIDVGHISETDRVRLYQVTALTAAGNLDIGSHNFTAARLFADLLTPGRVAYVASGGQIFDHSNLTYDDTNHILNAVKIGAFEAAGAIDFANQNMTNVDIDSGDIAGGVTISGDLSWTAAQTAITINSGSIGGGLTWSAAQNLNSQALTNVDINSGTLNGITALGIVESGGGSEMQIAVTQNLTDDRLLTFNMNDGAREISLSGNLTLANNFITSGNYATTLTTTGITGVTLPTTGTLATLAGNEILSNKTFVDSSTAFKDDTTATKIFKFQASGISANTTRTLTIPDANGTIVLVDTAATLENKTISGGSNTLSNIANASLTNSTITMAASAGSADAIALGETFTITAGEGIDTTMGANLVTIAGEDASATNKGIASFNTDNFLVSSGAVTIKDGGVNNDELAGSIANAKLANSSITVSDGSNTSPVALGGTLSFAGTANETTVVESAGTVTIGLPDNVTIAGNLTVDGTTTTVNSTTVTIDDPLFALADNNSADAVDIGWYGKYVDSGTKYSGIFRDASDSDKWKIFATTGNSNAAPSDTVNTTSGFTLGVLEAATFEGALTGDVTGTASHATQLATARDIGGVSFNGTANIDLPGVNAVGNQNTTGSAATLTNARNIGGVSFNGSASITLPGVDATGNQNTTGSAATLTTGRTIGMTGDVVWTSPAFNGSGDITAAAIIQADAVEAAMLNPNIISGLTNISGSTDTTNDFVMVWDATDSELKKSPLSGLGISGTAAGSANEVQYNNSNSFAGATNVEIKNNHLAFKEVGSAPGNTSGFGMMYAKTDNELYYKDDGGNETKITSGGGLAGGGAFRAVKAYLSGHNTIGTGSSTTPTAWTESYDVGAFHDGGSNTDRFTFGQVGYYEIKIQQEWAADAAGYREMAVERVDVSASTHDGVILRDRMDGSSNATVSGASTTIYIDDAADYVKVNLYQNSGADLVAVGNNDDATAISITRVDVATQGTNASGASGRLQFSDGSGGFNSDGDLTFVTDTLTATKLGAFEAAGAINFANQNMTNVDIDSGDMTGVTISGALTWSAAQNLNSQALTNINIDSGDISAATISGGLTWSSAQNLNSQALTNANIDTGDIASAVTINKSPTITLTGEVTASATAMTNLGNVSIATTVDDTIISGQSPLTSGLATTDELLVSDAGTIKRMDMSVLYAATATLTNKSIDLGTNTLTGSVAEFNTALQSESFATLGGTETLVAKTLTTPTISSTGFANANHAHAASNSGGQITLGTGTTGDYVATVAGTSNEIEVSGSTGAVTIGIPTNPTLGGNVTISGDLTVSGDTTTINTATLAVEDPLVSLATGNNSSDAIDIGMYGLYDTSGSQDLYGGLFRDANDSGKWKLFKDNQAAPTTTVDTSGTGYAVGTLVANLEGAVTGNLTGTADVATAVTLYGSGNVTYYPTFVDATSGNENMRVDSDWTYNASTNKMTVGNIGFADNGKIEFGDSQDFKLYHNGTANIIEGNGTADIKIQDSAHTSAIFDTSAEVQLYYDNSKKFETTAAGATVTGDLTISGKMSAASGALNLKDRLFINNNGSTSLWHAPGAIAIISDDNDNQTDSDIIFGTNSTTNASGMDETMRITDPDGTYGGNVGIGIATPVDKLDVDGTIQITRSGSRYVGTSASGAAIAVGTTGGAQIEFEASGNDDKLHLITHESGVGHARRLTVDETGNVGIGVSDPDAKLEVAGQVKITGGSPGADKILTSDANGLATWEEASSGGGTGVAIAMAIVFGG